MKQKDSSHRGKKMEILINHYNLWFVLFEGCMAMNKQIWAAKSYLWFGAIENNISDMKTNGNKEISSLSHSIVFLYCWLLRKAYSSLLAILWNFLFKWVYLSFSPLPLASLLFSAICKATSDSHFAFWISFCCGWSWSLPPL